MAVGSVLLPIFVAGMMSHDYTPQAIDLALRGKDLEGYLLLLAARPSAEAIIDPLVEAELLLRLERPDLARLVLEEAAALGSLSASDLDLAATMAAALPGPSRPPRAQFDRTPRPMPVAPEYRRLPRPRGHARREPVVSIEIAGFQRYIVDRVDERELVALVRNMNDEPSQYSLWFTVSTDRGGHSWSPPLPTHIIPARDGIPSVGAVPLLQGNALYVTFDDHVLEVPLEMCRGIGPSTTSTDNDGDTLPDFDEARLGTSAHQRDSDADGLDDDVDALPLDPRVQLGEFAEVALVDMGWTAPFNTANVSIIHDEAADEAFVFVEPLSPWSCARVVRRAGDGSLAAAGLHDGDDARRGSPSRRCAPD